MVTGIKRDEDDLSLESVLKKVDSYSIYRYYLGPFEIGKSMHNKFRGDDDCPSFRIKVRDNGELSHWDWARESWRGGCINFVMQIYNCDFPAALRYINKDLNLGLCGEEIDINRVPITWTTPEFLTNKKPPTIQFTYNKNWSKEQIDYWDRLRVGERNARADNIYSPDTIRINKRKVYIPDLCFIYHYPEDKVHFKGGSTAIYRPFAEKKRKWFKNVTFSYVEHIDKIEEGYRGFVCKSKKERLIACEILQEDNLCTVQAENKVALNDDALGILLKCPERYCLSDNDSTGTEFSWILTTEYGFKHINVPYNIPSLSKEGTICDIADWVWDYGYKTVEDYFRKKQLI
jgi:hypothetical protein